jgi:hypothetical protein
VWFLPSTCEIDVRHGSFASLEEVAQRLLFPLCVSTATLVSSQRLLKWPQSSFTPVLLSHSIITPFHPIVHHPSSTKHPYPLYPSSSTQPTSAHCSLSTSPHHEDHCHPHRHHRPRLRCACHNHSQLLSIQTFRRCPSGRPSGW